MSTAQAAPALPMPGGEVSLPGLTAPVAASAAALAGLAHVLATPEHLEEVPLAGLFFGLLALVQLGLALGLVASWGLRRPVSVVVLLAAVLGHVGVVALYVLSRTADLAWLPAHTAHHLPVAGGVGNGEPVLPGAHREPVGVLDLACLLAELVLVSVLVSVLPRRTLSACTWLLAAVAVAGVGARLTGLLG